ncbi:hypothetical protein DFH09DRAFT_1360277 [Mycena vulgaris]|nr:hypothetical protein DFH09DRAFT_1360277 [Mycena vulgaris]
MSETPSVKRKRAEPDLPESTSNPPVRSKIWMPYGDLILQAESTQFRVNRDVLAQQSSVFSDMLSVPQPPNEPMVEGCPIVLVSDSAKDWDLLLGFLYNPFQYGTALPFDVLASMLRLGRKYDFSAAKANAVKRIHSEFPDDLEAWNEAAKDMTSIEARPGILVDLLDLAYECGVTSSIPTLAFCCLRANKLEPLLTGIEHEDGSRLTLPDHVKLALAIALERIVYFQHEVFGWLEDDSIIPDQSCVSKIECTTQRQMIHRALISNDNGAVRVRCYGLDSWDDDWPHGLCDICRMAGKSTFDNSRDKLWEALPTFFGLPEWTKLKDVD